MRIIAGEFRGRKLLTPEWKGVRPTSDLVRESIFNIVQNYIYGADVLDLFAGSGALGIEALSRGANSATFCDNDRRTTALVKKNLQLVGKEDMTVIPADWRRALSLLKGKTFDIVFLDPPYDQNNLADFLCVLDQTGVIKETTTIVYEFSEQNGLPDVLEGYIIDKRKRYGKTGVAIIVKG